MSFDRILRSKVWLRAASGLLLVVILAAAAFSYGSWWPAARKWLASGGETPADGEQATSTKAGAANPDAADHPHDDLTSLHLSDQALKNIEFREWTIAKSDYWRTVSIPGVVVEQPGRGRLAVPAPMTGIVTQLHVVEGEAIVAGQAMFELRLTHEELVQAQGEFLTSVEQLDVITQEVERLQLASNINIGGQSVSAIAGKTLLEQRYRKQTLEAELRAHRQRLMLHGLTEQQIASIETNHQLLQHLTVFAPIPHESVDPRAAPRLQVSHLTVKPGQHVTAGESMCELSNHEELLIAGQAFSEDSLNLNRAANARWPVKAIDESSAGRDVIGDEPGEELHILYLSDEIERESRALQFFVRLPNRLIRDFASPDGNKHYIGWRFKPGQRLRIEVPVEMWEQRIVVPVEAIVRDGAEFYVFQRNGDHWDRRPVHVERQDSQWAVIEPDGSVFDGDIIAGAGAFEMQQTLKAQSSGGAGGHHGHMH